ncbi:MAG TPA: polyhydroxyalkanoate depolymerase [Burkholderiaceae bacterium]|nr:polyhydroxyalkanoate depolymerase [Burkholderiaceae bacterium]
MLLYQAYQAHLDLLWPWRTLARSAAFFLDAPLQFDYPEFEARRRLAASYEVFALAGLTHNRPPFGIKQVKMGAREVTVAEEVTHKTPFCDLLHFRKAGGPLQPRVLLVAPMSGHFATLLRETVRTMLPEHDVYITDWRNARDVALAHGRFGFDEYIAHVMTFLDLIGPGAHVVAVCQPCVAVLAAAALLAAAHEPAQPRTMTLIAGPIDCRISPTAVNKMATSKPIDWFERNLIGLVPLRYPGALRRVYPGFLQLSAFMSMNLERHTQAFTDLFNHLSAGDRERAETMRTFYDEYFAVADLPAEFYLETVERVFQQYLLARGELAFRGEKVSPAAIKRTALLTVEGERDDICALGQTLAAHDLCTGIPRYLKQHCMAPGVGHYGVFSGRRWQQQIYPIVRDLIYACDTYPP